MRERFFWRAAWRAAAPVDGAVRVSKLLLEHLIASAVIALDAAPMVRPSPREEHAEFRACPG